MRGLTHERLSDEVSHGQVKPVRMEASLVFGRYSKLLHSGHILNSLILPQLLTSPGIPRLGDGNLNLLPGTIFSWLKI